MPPNNAALYEMNLTAELEAIFAKSAPTIENDESIRSSITTNFDALNAIADECIGTHANSSTARAAAVCRASKLIFSDRDDRVVTAADAGYSKEEQVNW